MGDAQSRHGDPHSTLVVIDPSEQALLEAIWAAPDDDAPRLVYADALLERGDPRGELIVRQCRGDAASELVEQHGDRWLGELAPVIARSSYRRGFLDEVWLARPRPDRALGPLIGHPLWRTVRRLEGSLAIALDPSMQALRILEVDHEPAHWTELLTGRPRAIEQLFYRPHFRETWDGGSDVTATPDSGGSWTAEYAHDELSALAECPALPALDRLALYDLPHVALSAVLAGSLLERLRRFEWRHGPLAVAIGDGLATITVAPTAALRAPAVLALIERLPARFAIALITGPRFDGRAELERRLGPRLRR